MPEQLTPQVLPQHTPEFLALSAEEKELVEAALVGQPTTNLDLLTSARVWFALRQEEQLRFRQKEAEIQEARDEILTLEQRRAASERELAQAIEDTAPPGEGILDVLTDIVTLPFDAFFSNPNRFLPPERMDLPEGAGGGPAVKGDAAFDVFTLAHIAGGAIMGALGVSRPTAYILIVVTEAVEEIIRRFLISVKGAQVEIPGFLQSFVQTPDLDRLRSFLGESPRNILVDLAVGLGAYEAARFGFRKG